MPSKDTGRASGPDFPCVSLDDALSHLRRPPTPAAVRFKIQSQARNGSSAQVAAYIDARLVFDRLDQVCGQQWTAVFEPLPDRLIPPPVDDQGELLRHPPLYVRCRLTVLSVTRQDVGEGSDPKAAFSDAIKRAAVHFGIGRTLYAMRLPWLREGEGDGELRRNQRGWLILDRRTERYCREQYELWLEKKGVRQFGEPLDHGDEPDAPGFEADRPQPQGTAAAEATADANGAPETREPVAAGAAPSSAPDSKTVAGRLRAVSDGTPGSALGSALERERIEHWRSVGRYKPETVEALAGLMCGQRMPDRLTQPQVDALALTLEIATRGKVTERDLAASLARLAEREDREAAAEELRERLVAKANEAELTPRSRRAA